MCGRILVQSINISFHQTLSVCLFVTISVCQSVSLSVYLSIYIRKRFNSLFRWYLLPPIYVSVCLSVCLSPPFPLYIFGRSLVQFIKDISFQYSLSFFLSLSLSVCLSLFLRMCTGELLFALSYYFLPSARYCLELVWSWDIRNTN